jgi:hypothetical protein
VLPNIQTADPETKIGSKSAKKFLYGFKQYVVDMQSGMINRVAVTPANVTDAEGTKYVMPRKVLLATR